MKVFAVFLAVTLIARAAPGDPGEAAIGFLEKVRDGKVNLEPGGDTALSAHTAVRKRRQIAKRLERMAEDIGSDPLELGAVKQDGDFAAAIVRKIGGFDPGNLKVFPVALVKSESGWQAAPLPASFENAGVGYELALRKRIEELENWMLRQQVLDLEKLQAATHQRMKARIEASLPENELRDLGARQVASRFLTACGKADLPTVLGFLGGLGSKLPADWSMRLKSAEKALASPGSASRPWRLVASPEVARAVVNDEDDGTRALFSVACLDPTGRGKAKPRIELVHFEMSKSTDGLWQINPPRSFLDESAASADDRYQDEDGGEHPDSGLIRKFPAAWSRDHPAAPQSTAELAAKTWLGAINGENFPELLAILKMDDEPEDAVRACTLAAQLWKGIRGGSNANVAIPLSFRSDESEAVGIYQILTPRDPDKLDPEDIHFVKSAGGWHWIADPKPATLARLQGWLDEEHRRISHTWQQQVLSECPVIENVDALQAPVEEEARKCVESWLTAIRQGDVTAAVQQMALLAGARSSEAALRNLGYGITDSREDGNAVEITAVYQGKFLSAVGARIRHAGGKAVFPLYPVIASSEGPRILGEVGLLASGSRSRDFLNNDTLARLGKDTSEEVRSDLQQLLKLHQMAVEAENGAPTE